MSGYGNTVKPGFVWPADALDFFGIPVIESPFVPEGQALIVSSHQPGFPWSVGEGTWAPEPYDEPPSTIKGYIQRKANALRRDLGLELVDYAAEARQERLRRQFTFAAERYLALSVRGAYSWNMLAGSM